jgi:hypothetical protein
MICEPEELRTGFASREREGTPKNLTPILQMFFDILYFYSICCMELELALPLLERTTEIDKEYTGLAKADLKSLIMLEG